MSSADQFNTIKIKEHTMGDLLTDATNENVKAIKEAINKTLDTSSIRTIFEKDKAAIDTIVKSRKKVHPDNIIASLQTMHSHACETFQTQYNTAKQAIKDLFKNPDFVTHLTKLELHKDADTLQKAMLEQLKTSHEAQLKAYKETVEKEISQILNTAQLERDRIFWLATLYENVPDMRKQIDALAQKRAQGSSGVELRVSDYSAEAIFSGIDIKDLDKIVSPTGSKINKQNDGLSIELNNSFWGFRYWHSSQNSLLVDAKLLVAMLPTQSIILEAGHNSNPEQAIKIARALYQAALESGRDPKDITLKVNGEAIPTDKIQEKLFKDDPQTYQSIQEKAISYRKAREENTKQTVSPKDSITKQSELKRKLSNQRPKDKTPTQEPEQTNSEIPLKT